MTEFNSTPSPIQPYPEIFLATPLHQHILNQRSLPYFERNVNNSPSTF